MSREILFRGMNANGDGWLYGDLRKDQHHIGIIPHNVSTWEASQHGIIYFEVKPETVGQYTGLNDRNGNKIFEGDILRSDKTCFKSVQGVDFNEDPVLFDNGKFTVMGCDLLMLVNDFCGEIIGNIHQ